MVRRSLFPPSLVAEYSSSWRLHSWRRRTKFCASVVVAGYSQSMSIPSKPRSLSRVKADDANLARVVGVEAAGGKCGE